MTVWQWCHCGSGIRVAVVSVWQWCQCGSGGSGVSVAMVAVVSVTALWWWLHWCQCGSGGNGVSMAVVAIIAMWQWGSMTVCQLVNVTVCQWWQCDSVSVVAM